MDRLLETGTYTFKWDALHNWVEESFHDQPLGFLLGNAARLEIEQRFLFQFTDRRAVRTADIIGQNFQAWNGIGARLRAEDEIPVGLVPVGLLRAGRHVDHALPDRTAAPFERAFEEPE